MSVLVDANILSEGTKAHPAPSVLEWITENADEIVVNAIIVGELLYGVLALPDGRRREHLLEWFESGVDCLPLIPIDSGTAHVWAALNAELKRIGRKMPIKDSLNAATALQHDLVVATRNTADFHHAGVKAVNPFNA